MSHCSITQMCLTAMLWIVECQAPLSMGFTRNGLPFSPPWDLPEPGIEPTSPASPAWQVDSLPLRHLFTSFATYLTYFSYNLHKSVDMKIIFITILG